MADVHNRKTRSYNMSRIRAKHTKPEIIVRKFLHSKGFRFRLHNAKLPGKPDITLPKYKTVIFVNGCFWHGHEGCKYFVVPKTRTEWWLKKIHLTKQQGHENSEKLNQDGWNVITIWECQLKKDHKKETLCQLLKSLAT